MSTISERVQRGAAYLDGCQAMWSDGRKWIRIVDLDRLDMAHRNNDVIGQIFGDYMYGPLSRREAMEMGFQRTGDITYEDLQAEWVRVITERRAAA